MNTTERELGISLLGFILTVCVCGAIAKLLLWLETKKQLDAACVTCGALQDDQVVKQAKPIEATCNLDGLAKLGWQAVECSICGSHAMAYPKPMQDPEWYHGIDDTGCSRFYHKDEVRPSSFGNPLYTSPQPRKHEKAEAALLSDELRLFENTCMSEKDTLRRTRIFLNTIAK